MKKKHNFHEKKFSSKIFLWKRKNLFETAETISSISQTFFTEGSKMQESVFLTTSVVFLEQSSKYIGFSFEALAKLFRQRTESPKTCKKLDISQKSVFLLITLSLNTLKTASTTLSESFAESPKEIRCLQKLQNYTIL